ncbi:YciI family protein [Sinorhizobium sp. BG8]|uniref:YciI family protein n=1 Tax=Sinorhizobium sp. BG8 TaxID=2613773 RepID=UPI00193EBD7D|nr:YciI family protein [Sinorhizobium sp. BG8]QRM56360.1 YciI family protein [Sinorhizobium sp. BG8]
MLYAVLCYNSEDVVCAWSKDQDDKVMADLAVVEKKYADQGRLGPVARLMPTTSATTVRKGAGETFVLDGPFAETKEQFLGFFIVDVETLDEAIEFARELSVANPGTGAYEIRPLRIFKPGGGAN